MTSYYYGALHEQFAPDELLRQCVKAEQAGFDGIACSDHLQPWWEPGHSGHAWVWLGALGQATRRVPIGTAVTPPGPRYHPVQIAQAWATLEFLFAGRPFLGFGSGEALNEVPLGEDWPPVPEQIERMEEALELIHALFEGKRLQVEGRHFKARGAILHTRPQRRPPIYVSAFGPRAAGVAARWGDGLWTLGDPDQAPGVIDAYRSACDDSGREPGEIALQAIFAWGADDHAALEGARVWKGAQPPEFYTQDWHDPREMQRHAEQQVSDEELCKRMTISSDPEVHADAARDVERMGATIVALANASGADPDGAISLYGKSVLPALRGVAVR